MGDSASDKRPTLAVSHTKPAVISRDHRSRLTRQARLDAGEAPIAVAGPLRRAAGAATGMAPLARAIDGLARRARIPLQAPDDDRPDSRATPPLDPYGLTERELLVLRLVARGRTNSQIGNDLYMSPKTASAHVSNILRKLQVTNRVQAAALAERAGLLEEAP